jgi:hypothetical protein
MDQQQALIETACRLDSEESLKNMFTNGVDRYIIYKYIFYCSLEPEQRAKCLKFLIKLRNMFEVGRPSYNGLHEIVIDYMNGTFDSNSVVSLMDDIKQMAPEKFEQIIENIGYLYAIGTNIKIFGVLYGIDPSIKRYIVARIERDPYEISIFKDLLYRYKDTNMERDLLTFFMNSFNGFYQYCDIYISYYMIYRKYSNDFSNDSNNDSNIFSDEIELIQRFSKCSDCRNNEKFFDVFIELFHKNKDSDAVTQYFRKISNGYYSDSFSNAYFKKYPNNSCLIS